MILIAYVSRGNTAPLRSLSVPASSSEPSDIGGTDRGGGYVRSLPSPPARGDGINSEVSLSKFNFRSE